MLWLFCFRISRIAPKPKRPGRKPKKGKNYLWCPQICKEANAEWEVLVEKYPNVMQVYALHALRLGLCVKVERRGITLSQATDIFEMARTSIIESKERQERRELEEAKKEGKGL